MFLYSYFVKSVILSIVVVYIMTDLSIDIPESAFPASVQKSSYSDFIRKLPSKLSLSSVKEWFGATGKNIRPWSEFTNTENFKTPPNLQRLLKRAVNNVSHFQGNYLTIALILMAYSLLTSPLLLLAIILTIVIGNILASRNATSKMFISGKEITLQQQYTILGVCSLPVYYWAGVGDLVFWVLGVTCFITSVHAAFYNIDVLIRPEEQLNLVMNQVI